MRRIPIVTAVLAALPFLHTALDAQSSAASRMVSVVLPVTSGHTVTAAFAVSGRINQKPG